MGRPICVVVTMLGCCGAAEGDDLRDMESVRRVCVRDDGGRGCSVAARCLRGVPLGCDV